MGLKIAPPDERQLPGRVRVHYDFKGEPMTAGEDYGPPPGKRWSAYRKTRLLNAIDAGVVRIEDACARYDLSFDEVNEWRDRFYQAGTDGMKASCKRHRRAIVRTQAA